MVDGRRTVREIAQGQTVYFIVQRNVMGQDFCSLIFDQLHKKQWSYERAASFRYRLEDRHLDMTFDELVAQYHWLKARNKLPPSNIADTQKNDDGKNRISYQG